MLSDITRKTRQNLESSRNEIIDRRIPIEEYSSRAVKYSSTLPAPEVLVLGRSSTQFEYSTEFSAICCEKAELAIALPGLQCHLLVTIEKQKFFHDFPRQYSFISGLENHSKKSYFCLF